MYVCDCVLMIKKRLWIWESFEGDIKGVKEWSVEWKLYKYSIYVENFVLKNIFN